MFTLVYVIMRLRGYKPLPGDRAWCLVLDVLLAAAAACVLTVAALTFVGYLG